MTERRHTLVCYDICEDKRLRRVHKTVRDYGQRLQYSIYACRLSEIDRAELEARLLEEILTTRDQAMLLDLGRADPHDAHVPRSRVLGHYRGPRWATVVVV